MSQPNTPENSEVSSGYALNETTSRAISGSGNLGQPASYTPSANTTVVGSSIISHLPDEELAGLRKMEFQLLLDGDISSARAGRDLFLGFLISGMIGLIGLVATTDWGDVFTKSKPAAAIWAAVMFAIIVASAVGVNHLRRKNAQNLTKLRIFKLDRQVAKTLRNQSQVVDLCYYDLNLPLNTNSKA